MKNNKNYTPRVKNAENLLAHEEMLEQTNLSLETTDEAAAAIARFKESQRLPLLEAAARTNENPPGEMEFADFYHL